ncbi:MAG: hypothetical protein ACPGYV_01805 [Phycisphaeraceae bacterium]
MTTALSQSVLNPPPELLGTTTLRIDSASPPAVLHHAFTSPQPTLHTRFMLNAVSLDAGSIAIAGGFDADGYSAWQLTLDQTVGAIRLDVGETSLAASLTDEIAWHTIEVGMNETAGLATLRINGVDRDSASATVAATASVWLGAAFINTNASGTLDLDRWRCATQPIGVPLSEPSEPDASDPRRWLVVYHRNDGDSAAWAEAYRQRRGVPHANLCGLDLPAQETITAPQFESMRQQIGDYLDDNALRERVFGVLLGYNVPGYADVAGQGTLTPIASYLHTDDAHGLPVVNPAYQSTLADRPTDLWQLGVRMTGRIDAPSLAEAIAMIDRADGLRDQPLRHDGAADVLIDINPDNPNIGPVYTQPVADWASGPGAASLRLPTVVFDAIGPAQATGESVLWGWRDAAPSSDFFDSDGGRRAMCLQFDPEPQPAVTLRDASASDWMNRALRAGYALSASPSRAYSLSALPLPHLFFGALRLGWTVAEAWLTAQPFLRDGLQIVGDPLAVIPFPKAGYDVFGPVDRLDQVESDTPLAILHAGRRSLTIEPDVVSDGASFRFLVRRIDEHGRSDLGSSAVFAAATSGIVERPTLPAWPDAIDWRIDEGVSELRATAVWATVLRGLGVRSVALQSQVGDEPIVAVATASPLSGQQRLSFAFERPTQPTRYRFVVSQDAGQWVTPWSAEVLPEAAPDQSLTLLER